MGRPDPMQTESQVRIWSPFGDSPSEKNISIEMSIVVQESGKALLVLRTRGGGRRIEEERGGSVSGRQTRYLLKRKEWKGTMETHSGHGGLEETAGVTSPSEEGTSSSTMKEC